MATPTDGRTTIEYLLGRGRLERIDGKTAADSAATMASHNVADVTVAPMAGPFAATTIGFLKSMKRSKRI